MKVSRRQLIKWGILGSGLGSLGVASLSALATSPKVKVPLLSDHPKLNNDFNPLTVLRDFDYGIVKRENNRVVREYHLTANSTNLHLNSVISFVSWNINGRVPGPTLRAKQGDLIRIFFSNQDGHSHSLHFHGIHSIEMDGIQAIKHDQTMIYEFEAKPYGVHLYHCHVAPVTRHVSKGLYGMFIVDPPEGRAPADEMALVMGGYDINNDEKNEIYAFNGIPNFYRDYPIPIYQHQLIRLYVLNMIEFDPVVTFHLHANFFQVYPTGMTLKPSYTSDVITMGTAERHILEFTYDYPGKFMFHPHQDYLAEHGCMGNFEVVPS